MNDLIKAKLEESYAAASCSDSDLTNRLLEEAFSMASSKEEEREAALYVRQMMRRGRKRCDVNASELLGDVRSALSLSFIAKTYFGKGASWLMQRVNGNIVNGRPAAFTDDELMTLSKSLADLGKKLLSVADGIQKSI